MSGIEFGQIFTPYEFEDRGNLFMAEVATIIKDFPDLLVDVENKTLIDLEANAWACKKSAEQNKTALYRKAFERGEEKDKLSATESTVMVGVHGNKRERIKEFKKMVDKCAKRFGGKKDGEDSHSGKFSQSDFKHYTYVNYCFRG